MKKTKNAQGTVKSTSPDSVVVAGKEKSKDAEWTFAVDSKTAIRKSGKAITAADLKAGDQVHVRYMDHDGKATAVAIQVKPGAAAAKATALREEVASSERRTSASAAGVRRSLSTTPRTSTLSVSSTFAEPRWKP